MKKLFEPDATRIGRPAGPAMQDAVPQGMADGTPRMLRDDLSELIGSDQVLHRVADLVRYASDASPYRYIPQVVVRPRTLEGVANLLVYYRNNGRKATFRAAGTSLNGQSQSDDVLIGVRGHWQGCSVEEEGRQLRTKPGTILAHANARLARCGRKLGPDPTSNGACTIGGVIAMPAALPRQRRHSK
ncbi:FAD/FMN-containing dehydrogenase [Phyllobacterium trifolii]|uniref:FAD/FMN-containing dehydrogenase n=2 Tax=Phyllobacterium trifolii TaxID=300193 RepID=A0A839ULK1_9HYPH|nr:FAD/FMN-containing dehydrogenase [Phyllobacterium trifolii]